MSKQVFLWGLGPSATANVKNRVSSCTGFNQAKDREKTRFFLFFSWFFLLVGFCFFSRKNQEKTEKKPRKNQEKTEKNQDLLSLEFFCFFLGFFLVFSRFFLEFWYVFFTCFFLFFFNIFSSQMVERCWVLLNVYTNTHGHCLYLIHNQGQLHDTVSHYGCRLSME